MSILAVSLLQLIAIASLAYAAWKVRLYKQKLQSLAASVESTPAPNENFRNPHREEMAQRLAEQSFQIDQLSHVLQQAKHSSNEFLIQLSGAIREPLANILGFADLLREAAPSPRSRSYAHEIDRSGSQLMDLLSDVVDLAELESGKVTSEKSLFGPKQLVEEVASLIRNRAEAKGLQVQVDYRGLLPEMAPLNVAHLRHAAMNLLTHAAQQATEGTLKIAVRTLAAETENAQLELTIAISDMGMSQEELESLFQPFASTQLPTSSTVTSGYGLGLAICWQLVDLMEGTLEATREAHGDSTFTLCVPLGSLKQARMIDPTQPSRVHPERRSCGKSLDCKALVVAPHRADQRLLSFILKKAGAQVELASNAVEGVTAATRAELAGKPFHVVIMDMQMPGMNGISATQHLRETGFTQPIIALLGQPGAGDRQRCIEAGCNELLAKPIDREKLLQLVEELAGHAVRLAAPSRYTAAAV